MPSILGWQTWTQVPPIVTTSMKQSARRFGHLADSESNISTQLQGPRSMFRCHIFSLYCCTMSMVLLRLGPHPFSSLRPANRSLEITRRNAAGSGNTSSLLCLTPNLFSSLVIPKICLGHRRINASPLRKGRAASSQILYQRSLWTSGVDHSSLRHTVGVSSAVCAKVHFRALGDPDSAVGRAWQDLANSLPATFGKRGC